MITYLLEDQRGETYTYDFPGRDYAIAFAVRSQRWNTQYRMISIHTTDNHLVWRMQ